MYSCFGEIEYDSSKPYSTYSFSGSGTSATYYATNFSFYVRSFFDDTLCIYAISRTGDIPGTFCMRSSDQYSNITVDFIKVNENDYSLPQGYSLYYLKVEKEFYCYHFINQRNEIDCDTFTFDITFIFVHNSAINFSIPSLYEQGVLDSITTVKNSLGIFQFGTFKCSLEDPLRNDLEDYSSWTYLPEEYIVGFYSGIELSFYGEELDKFVPYKEPVYGRYIVCDFGEYGISFDEYTNFHVIRISGKNTFTTGEYGVSVTFRFTDDSEVGFDTSDEYFSNIDLSSYVGKKLRSVVWRVSREDLQFIGLTSYKFYDEVFNVGHTDGYMEGVSDGFDDGFDVGYNKGLIEGKVIGKNQALETGSYTFLDLMGAVVDAPVQAISGLLDFDLLGFNMLNFFFALCTCALIIAVVRIFL